MEFASALHSPSAKRLSARGTNLHQPVSLSPSWEKHGETQYLWVQHTSPQSIDYRQSVVFLFLSQWVVHEFNPWWNQLSGVVMPRHAKYETPLEASNLGATSFRVLGVHILHILWGWLNHSKTILETSFESLILHFEFLNHIHILGIGSCFSSCEKSWHISTSP